ALYGDGETIHGLFILWSLSVEEHYYLIFPFCLAFLRRRNGAALALGFCALIFGWRAVRYYYLGSNPLEIYLSTDTRIDSIVFGSVLALLEAEGRARSVLPQGLGRWPVLAGAFLLLLVTFLYRDDDFRAVPRYTLQGLALIPIFHFAVHRPRDLIFRPLNLAPMRLIGRYSYSLYLVHLVVMQGLRLHQWDHYSWPLFFVMSAVISLAISALIYELVERPSARLRRQLEHRN
ncbi:MAG: acyltransferase, partial [Pseudomonadota bacterium]